MSLLVGLGITETAVRCLGFDHPLVWQPDPVLGWRHIPGARLHWTEEGNGLVQINRLGYRDRERQLAKDEGTFRIAVFGDSMTEAIQVNFEQTFTSVLEAGLAGHVPQVEVLNFGVNGYSPIQEFLTFRQESPRYRPDLVILGLFLDNDVADCHPDLTTHQDDAVFLNPDSTVMRFDYSRAAHAFACYHGEPSYSLRRYFATYRFASYATRRRREMARAGSSSSGIPKRFGVYHVPQQPEWEQAWVTLERVLLEFAAEAKCQGMSFMVLSIPAGQVVNERAWQEILATYPAMRTEQWDLKRPEQRLLTFAAQHDIAVIRPAERFEFQGPGTPLFFGNVGHLTAAGHALIAAAIEESLRSRVYLPSARSNPNLSGISGS